MKEGWIRQKNSSMIEKTLQILSTAFRLARFDPFRPSIGGSILLILDLVNISTYRLSYVHNFFMKTIAFEIAAYCFFVMVSPGRMNCNEEPTRVG